MRHFHQPAGSSDSTDPATWVAASYQSHPVDFLEPIDLEPNGYRQAAIRYLGIMFAVDEFITAAQRCAARDYRDRGHAAMAERPRLDHCDIVTQTGCTPAALTRSIARFKTMAGLDSNGGVRPGAGSLNGDTPAAAQSIGNIPQEPGPIAW